jgi:WD40 repeat protein
MPARTNLAFCLSLLLSVALWPTPSNSRDTPQDPAATARPTQRDQSLRDLYGDPIPAGALVRLGTLRFRAPGDIDALAFAHDGRTLAVASNFGLVTFDADGKRIARLPTPRNGWGMYNRIAFSPDGKRLSGRARVEVGAEGKLKGIVRVWDLTGRNESLDYEAEGVICLGWSAAGEPLAVCLEPGAVCLRELAAGRSRRFPAENLPTPQLFTHSPSACASGGKTIAVVNDNHTAVYFWDAAKGELRHTIRPKAKRPNGNAVYYLAMSDDGCRLAVSNDRGVRVWDLTSGKELFTKDDKTTYRNLLFSPDGKLLAVLQTYDTVAFWDATTGREAGRTREKYHFAEAFHFTAEGKTLATAERHAGAVHLFDVPSGERKPEPAGHRARPHGVTFSPDGRRVATSGGLDGTIYFWELATGKSVSRVERPFKCVRDIALSPDGRWLYSTWTDESLWISDATTGELRHTIKLDDPDQPDTRQSAFRMGLSDDGRTMVALSSYYAKQGGGPQDTLITGWDTSTRKQRFRRRSPGVGLWAVLSADARVLAMPHTEVHRFGKSAGGGPI